MPNEPGSEAGPGWIASGFFYGRRVGTNNDGLGQFAVYLLTNRHVFEGLDTAVVRANPSADDPAPARDYPLVLRDRETTFWIAHPDPAVDVAAIKVDFNRLQSEGMQVAFFEDDRFSLNAAQIKEAGISEGDYVFVLGYPMGLVGDHRAVVIVRNGSLARIRDALERPSEPYLVDSTIFPGNSGRPIITKIEAIALQGTSAISSTHLIGIVTGYVSYTEAAVSAQTNRLRMIFEENSGLASAHLVDAINECIESDPLLHQMRMQFAAPPPAQAESSGVSD